MLLHQTLASIGLTAATPTTPTAVSRSSLSSSTTTTEPIPLNTSLPYPYQSGSIRLTTPFLASGGSPSSPKPTAVLSLESFNPCGGGTSFLATRTVILPIDCLGAQDVSVSIRPGRCPLGMIQPPGVIQSDTSTLRTHWQFSCAPSPTTSLSEGQPTYDPAKYPFYPDITHSMPLPSSFRPEDWENPPPELVTDIQVVHRANGDCNVQVAWRQREPEKFAHRRERIVYECLQQWFYPTVYRDGIVTMTIGVACDGCRFVRGGDLGFDSGCPRNFLQESTRYGFPSGDGTGTVRGTGVVTVTEEVGTRWVYDCEVTTGAAMTATAMVPTMVTATMTGG